MNTNPIIIGLAGRKGSGKTTLAEILRELIPGSQVVGFADALKDDVIRMVNAAAGTQFTRDDVEREKAACWGPILQGYGELRRRHDGVDYWVDRLASVLPSRAIVADVRYPNEAAFLKCQNGLIVYVEGPDRRDADTRSVTHPSEVLNEQPWGDVVVTNHSTIAHLRDQAKCIVRIARNLAETEGMVLAR